MKIKNIIVTALSVIMLLLTSCNQMSETNGELTVEDTNSSRAINGVETYPGYFLGGTRHHILVKKNDGIILKRKYSDTSVRNLINKPNNTWFGGWSYNSKNDTIEGIGDFDGDGKDDILISSKWGIGVLEVAGPSLYNLSFKSYVCKPNGTRFKYWSYNSANDTIQGIADFNNDGKDDILITSSWGVGILTYSNGSFKTLVCKPFGTRFGGWYYGKDDTLGHFGDFNNNGKTDIVVQSSWGIGFLEYNGGDSLNCFMGKPFGTRFNHWSYYKGQEIKGVGNYDGKAGDDLLITSDWGVGILKLNGSSLYSIVCQPYGDFMHKYNDQIILTGDFDGDGDSDILQQVRLYSMDMGVYGGLGVLTVEGGKLEQSYLMSSLSTGLLGRLTVEDNVHDYINDVLDWDNDGDDDFIIDSGVSFGVVKKTNNGSEIIVETSY